LSKENQKTTEQLRVHKKRIWLECGYNGRYRCIDPGETKKRWKPLTSVISKWIGCSKECWEYSL